MIIHQEVRWFSSTTTCHLPFIMPVCSEQRSFIYLFLSFSTSFTLLPFKYSSPTTDKTTVRYYYSSLRAAPRLACLDIVDDWCC